MEYSNWQLIKDLAHFVRPYWKRFTLGSILRVTSDLVWLYPPFALGQIINFATTYQPGDSLQWFWQTMIIIWVAGLYHYITHDLAKYLVFPVGEQARLDAYLESMNHLFMLDMSWHEKENSGNKIQRITKGTEAIDQIMRMYIELMIESSVNIIGVTIVLMTLGPVTSLIMVSFFATYFFLSIFLTQRVKNQSLKTNMEWEVFDGLTFEAVNNISTVKSLGLRQSISAVLGKAAKQLMAAIRIRIFYYRSRSAVLNMYREFFRQVMIVYVVLSVFNGELAVGVIATLMLYFQKIATSAEEFAEVSYHFILGRIAVMRMKDILNEKPKTEISGRQILPKNWKTLRLENLTFSYGARPVLKNLNFTIKRGEKIGIVGISGTGKSTLFKLLLKLYDTYEGEIYFDKTPLSDIKRSSLVQHTSYVPQDTELFNFSLKDNVTLTNGTRLDAKAFDHAIQIAHVKDFIHKLPNGVDSLIGEKGIKLSGGEKQRVGIARAVYKQPEILFMDEATSHLDSASEEKIQEALHSVFKNITAIVIAHRLSTLKEMDRILVMKQGELVEEGSYTSLIKKQGEFWHLWKKQKF